MSHRDPGPEPPPAIDDELLRSYLADALPAEDLARVEKALRDSAELRQRLEDVRQNRDDLQTHTLGAIWRRSRLSCATRQQLGWYLLDALDPELGAYIKFHVEVVACPFCQANLADIEAKASESASAAARRQALIHKVHKTLLRDDGRP